MNQDPRRTVAGNLIDNRLALGIARSFIGEIDQAGSRAEARYPRELPCGSQRERKAAFLRLKEACGPLFLGMSVRPNLREGLVAALSPHREPDRPYNAIAVITYAVDLGRPGRRGPRHEAHWPYYDMIPSAMIDIHALARLVQRAGTREPAEILGLLRRVSAWSAIATGSGDVGSWMLPVGNGLVCAQRSGMVVPGFRDEPVPVPLIKTFISRDGFNLQNAGAWDRLVANGALEARPRFPSFDAPDPEHVRLWGLMRDEGRGWDLRREHAIRTRGRTEDLQDETGPVGEPEPDAPEPTGP